MAVLAAIQGLIERLIGAMTKGLAWASVLLMLVTVLVVALRYGFNLGWIALQDSSLFLHGLVFMAGSAYTLQQDKHVRVDVFYRRFAPSTQAWINLLGCLTLLIPVVVFIAISSHSFIAMAWQTQESSPEAGGLPGFFLLKSYLWLFCALMLLQATAELIKSLSQILRQEAQS